jgi:flagellar M-ring protein FliF
VIIQTEPRRTLLNEIIEAVTHVSSNRATRLNQRDDDSRQPITSKVSVSKVSPDKPTLTSVRLSIGIPESYYQKVWQLAYLRDHQGRSIRDVPALGPTELTALQQHTKTNITTAVTPALISRVRGLGFYGDESAAAVDVWSFPDLTAEPAPEPTQVTTGITWVSQAWRQIAVGLLACVMVWILFGTLRSGENKNAGQVTAKSRQIDTSAQDTANTEIIDELSSLVDQHPDLAADAIRSWVGEAA